MPSWQRPKRFTRPAFGSYHVKRPNPFGTNWVMSLTMVGVSIWSCFDGRQSVAMMLVAAVGTVALLQVISHLFSLLRPTRFTNALYSGSMVAIFMPVWDWLSAQLAMPASLWTALGFGLFFGIVRWSFSPRGPGRPPS